MVLKWILIGQDAESKIGKIKRSNFEMARSKLNMFEIYELN